MKKILVTIAAFSISYGVNAAPLSAVMTFESMAITSEGVKKQTQFQEQFIRDNNVVWSARIIPASAPQHKQLPNEHDDEHNLNFATAGKWIVRDANNTLKFRFVRVDEKKIIEPRTSDYGTLGFDGQWETAYYLLDRTALKKMTKLNKPSAEGTSWYEKTTAQDFTRILWDERNQLPLSIESGRTDGTLDNKITLAIVPAPKIMPWQKTSGYQTVAYEDLLD